MIVILGGGPAGRLASIRLACAGREVTLVERGGIGGQCLHFGCMPVCALNDVARLLQSTRTLRDLGVIDSAPAVRFPDVLLEMQKIQATITGILDKETREAGVKILYGNAGSFDGERVVVDNRGLDADAVILSTGSRPNIPPVFSPLLPGVYTPHTLPAMPRIPERIAIVGGGIMAAEFAYIFSRFGSHVTIISRSGFLKSLDEHLRKRAIRELASCDIRENCDISAIREDGGGVALSLSSAGKTVSEETFDTILIAAGLVPNSENLTGLAKRPNGEVIVDEYMRTNIPCIYAAGDLTGPPFLTPVARQQGIVAADNILGLHRKMDYSCIPQSLNLGYELAFCSNGNPRAKPLVIPGPAGPDTFWGVPASDTGLAKLMVAPDGTISGLCSASPGGGLIAGYMAFLMKRNFSVHDFTDFIEVHPSTDGVYGLAKYASEILKKRGSG